MLTKDLCEMTTYAKTRSTQDIVRAVENFLIVEGVCGLFFFYTGKSLIVDTVLCMPGGNPFIHSLFCLQR